MDLLTLTISTVFLSAMMAITLGALYLTNKTDNAMRDWSMAGVCFLFCSALLLFASVHPIPWIISPVLSNTFYVIAHGFILSGITQQTRKVNSYTSISVFAAFVFALHFNAVFANNVEYRIVAIYPVIITLNVLSLVQLWRFRHSAFGKSYWAAIIIIALYIVHCVINAIATLCFPEELAFLGSDIVQTTNTLVCMLYVTSITLCLIFIHCWKREVALKTISRTDALTGWLNRHALNDSASREFSRCQRSRLSFAFITFDIDYFKAVNDNYGHIIGDHALQHIASVAKEATREYDYHFRLGGEEFVIMVAGLKVCDIKVVAERVRKSIQTTPFRLGAESLPLSISVGMATMEANDADWHVVLERADNALYAAKKGGRNKTRYFSTNTLSLVKG